MNIKIDEINYTLDVEAALAAGVLKKKVYSLGQRFSCKVNGKHAECVLAIVGVQTYSFVTYLGNWPGYQLNDPVEIPHFEINQKDFDRMRGQFELTEITGK